MLKITQELLIGMLSTINIGIVLLDSECRVVLINDWVINHLETPEKITNGVCFYTVFPKMSQGRIHEAIKMAIHHNLSSTLSPSLNKSPLPLFSSPLDRKKGIRMQQAIQIIPIQLEDAPRYCLLQITDVTLSIHREKLLRNQALLLREQSYFDALTGVANRRRFNEYAEDEFRRARRTVSPFSLLMIDVDHFKLYNDYYGHLEGDHCLKQVAMTLARTIKRPADLLTRYGGEEFAVILPDTNREGSYTVADGMLNEIRNLKIEHIKSLTSPYVTVSIGAATTVPKKNELVTDLIKIADRALYYAKGTGRNKIVFATEEGTIFS